MESGVITIGDLITRIRQESDQVNSQFVTDPEIVTYLSASYKELYDLLTTSYGDDYYVATPASFTTNGTSDIFPLPDNSVTFLDSFGNPFVAPAFYKILGLDLQLSPNNPQGFVTIKTFPFSERNRYAIPNFATFWGFTNVRYRIRGNFIWLTPMPAFGQVFRLFYIPRPTDLIFSVQGTTTIGSAIMTVPVSSQLVPQVGMNLFGSNIASNTTVIGVTGTSVTMSNNALGPGTSTVQMFDYQSALDGISGWEEYPVVDVAIKIKDKEESDVQVLGARKAAMLKRVVDTAANRDPGQAARTADVLTDIWNTPTGTGDGGGSNY
jgi:hypothetical protein